MSCVHTGNIASAAAGTILPQKFRIAYGTAVQLFRCCHSLQSGTYQFPETGDPVTVHIVRQTADQVGDDPIAILHHRCGDLDIAAPQRQKLHRIPPGLNAAHAADGNTAQFRTDRHIVNMAQCNGFHRLAGIAADCGFSHHARMCLHGLFVNAGNAFDGIDRRQTVCACPHSGDCRNGHIGDIGSHLCQHRQRCAALDRRCICLHQLYICPHITAHALYGHLRTGEIAFDDIASGICHQPSQLRPLVLRFAHDGRNDDTIGIVLFQPPQKVQVFLQRMVGNLFQIPKSQKRISLPAHGVESGRDLFWSIKADGLEHDTAPALLQRPGTHFIIACHNGGGKEKGIDTRHAAERNGKVCRFLCRCRRKCCCHFSKRHLLRTGAFAGMRTGYTRYIFHCRRCPGKVFKADTPHHCGRVCTQPAGSCTRCIITEHTLCRLLFQCDLRPPAHLCHRTFLLLICSMVSHLF